MTRHNPQKLLQPLPPMLNHIVAKPIGEDLAGQGWDVDTRRLPLEHIPEVLEVAVAAAHRGLLQLEGGDVGNDVDLVVGVHVAACAVGSRVADLCLFVLTISSRFSGAP